MTAITSDQEALITYELVKWEAAHCREHQAFDASCPECQAVPQACEKHPKVNGSYPGFDIGCAQCMSTRPGHSTVQVGTSHLVTAEEACKLLGIPHQVAGKILRVPLNLLRRH